MTVWPKFDIRVRSPIERFHPMMAKLTAARPVPYGWVFTSNVEYRQPWLEGGPFPMSYLLGPPRPTEYWSEKELMDRGKVGCYVRSHRAHHGDPFASDLSVHCRISTDHLGTWPKLSDAEVAAAHSKSIPNGFFWETNADCDAYWQMRPYILGPPKGGGPNHASFETVCAMRLVGVYVEQTNREAAELDAQCQAIFDLRDEVFGGMALPLYRYAFS
jgi:hypothetical protein